MMNKLIELTISHHLSKSGDRENQGLYQESESAYSIAKKMFFGDGEN